MFDGLDRALLLLQIQAFINSERVVDVSCRVVLRVKDRSWSQPTLIDLAAQSYLVNVTTPQVPDIGWVTGMPCNPVFT